MSRPGAEPMVDESAITDADILRSRADPRFRQILLARMLAGLLDRLYRLQHAPPDAAAACEGELREGASMAVRLADTIRAIDEKLRPSAGARES